MDFFAEIEQLPPSFSGAAGGLLLFVYGIKTGHYKRNRYYRKLLVEIVGAALTAHLASFFVAEDMQIPVGFCIGFTWTSTLQTLRLRVTKMIDRKLTSVGGEAEFLVEGEDDKSAIENGDE